MERFLDSYNKKLEAYRKTWERLSKGSKLLISSLIVVGILQMMIGAVLICQ